MTTKVNDHNIETDTIVTVGVLTSLEIAGSLHAGSANLGNLVVGNYFQGDGSLLTNVAIGTLSNLTVTGNVTLGTVSNVHITGGTTGQYIKTDGAGNLSFGSVAIPDIMHPFLLGL
jgi:hypothetical protein